MRYYSRVDAERRRQTAEHVADLLSSDEAIGDPAGPFGHSNMGGA
jgi:hypothetical protein